MLDKFADIISKVSLQLNLTKCNYMVQDTATRNSNLASSSINGVELTQVITYNQLGQVISNSNTQTTGGQEYTASERLKKRIGVDSGTEYIMKQKRKVILKLQGLSPDRPARQILEWRPSKKRTVGRTSTRIFDISNKLQPTSSTPLRRSKLRKQPQVLG
uniref:Reverse transcriptase domain-containing protein n=1 Tax=Rhabditophanes sp. KR3021 TaxID=114890 RepID=A0AC35TI12_9BILA